MLSNTGVRYGLLGGAVVVIYFLVLYNIGTELFLSPLLQWGSIGFYLVFMWLAAKADATQNGAARDFREILRTPFIVFLVINLCYWLMFYALHLYDINLAKAEIGMAIQNIKAQIDSGIGDPQQVNMLQNNLIELEKNMQSPPTQPLGQIITSMFVGALGGFALSAGVAVIMRSKA